jgi:hypothetical protein
MTKVKKKVFKTNKRKVKTKEAKLIEIDPN